jgi:hypothetical protein
VHIDEDGTLSLIHVKKAGSTSQSREVAASAFEVVVGQAAKNSRLLVEPEVFKDTIETHDTPARAAFTYGRRVSGYSEFLKKLDGLPPGKRQVVVVQPHVSAYFYAPISRWKLAKRAA